MKKFVLLFALLFSFSFLTSSRAAPPTEAVRAIALIDYMARDYSMAVADEGGKIISEAEYAEMKNFSGLIGGYLNRLKLTSETPAAGHYQNLKTLIDEQAPVARVRETSLSLKKDLLQQFSVVTFPSKTPDLERGKVLYDQMCATCHGLDGRANTPTAAQLDPKPPAFADPEVLNSLSPFQAFNTITFGVDGTPMASFVALSEEDRWALASRLFLFRDGLTTPETAIAPELVRTITNKTDSEILNEWTQKGLSPEEALRRLSSIRHLHGVSAKDTTQQSSQALMGIQFSQEKIREALTAASGGDKATALDLSVTAYLDGFEKTEILLRSLKGGEIVAAIEKGFLEFRDRLQSAPDLAQDRGLKLVDDLEAAKNLIRENRVLSPSITLLGAYSIILREGLEALLLIAVILSVLRQMKDVRLRRVVHLNWVLALVLGGVTWIVAQKLMTGIVRENMEGWMSLVAAAVLIYVSFWLIAKKDAEKWKAFLIGKLKGRFGVMSVGLVAFLAVYREAFETILFIEALKLQAVGQGHYLSLGVALGFVSLAVVGWLIFRLGKWIPLNIFFGLSGVFLYTLAVIFVGQGIHSLQEANMISQTLVPFFTVPTLGIYPILESLLAQLALVLIFLSSLFWQQWVRRPREEQQLEAGVTRVSTELLGLHDLGEHLIEHLKELKTKLTRGPISDDLMKEILSHAADLDHGIHQVILRLNQVSSDIPKRFGEIYEGLQDVVEEGDKKEKLLRMTDAFKKHLDSLK